MIIKDLICSVLEENENARADDTLLYVECAKKLGARTLNDLCSIGLSIITVHKFRQVIQNKKGLYLPSEEVLLARKQKEKEFKEIIKNL